MKEEMSFMPIELSREGVTEGGLNQSFAEVSYVGLSKRLPMTAVRKIIAKA